MLILLHIAGVMLICLALLHIGFPRYFHWKEELAHLSLINRQMFLVHAFFIGFVIVMMGILCLTSGEELLGTRLGRHICLGMALFWMIRLVLQFFGYSSRLWRGKRFETIVHILASIYWLYLSLVFSLAGLGWDPCL